MNPLSIDPTEPDRLLTAEEVAAMLHLNVLQIESNCQTPRFWRPTAPRPYVVLRQHHREEKIPLFRRSDILQWLQEKHLEGIPEDDDEVDEEEDETES